MIKTLVPKLSVLLFVVLLLGSTLSGVAFASSTGNCFDNEAPIICPTDLTTLKDTNNLPMTLSNCYELDATSTDGQDTNAQVAYTGTGTWSEVECTDPSVPVPLPSSDSCGGPKEIVYTSIDFGCQHIGNPILDMLFAIIKLLSDGVGIVVIASVIVGGIQYTTSAGDPNAAAKAIGRIRTALMALLIFIFAYAILNYVVPGAFLK